MDTPVATTHTFFRTNTQKRPRESGNALSLHHTCKRSEFLKSLGSLRPAVRILPISLDLD